MRTKFKAALGSLLISGALAGAAVMPAASNAHGENGPLCWGNVPGGAAMTGSYGALWGYLGYGEPFRVLATYLIGDVFLSQGHSASSNRVDYVVYTNDLRCDHPPF